jgi:hypothetical protein
MAAFESLLSRETGNSPRQKKSVAGAGKKP